MADLAERLLAVGIPVVVIRRGAPHPTGWQNITAEQCDLSRFRPGKDVLAMVCGHGIDVVDEDSKNGGSVENLPPFKHYGVTRTPSGGRHFIVPTAGLGKISPLTTVTGHVGDYGGGREDGSGRMLAFLPGSTRDRYPGKEYVEEEVWDVEACLAADADPDLVEALENAGGGREQRADHYVDDSSERDPNLGPHPYAAHAVEAELARLDECDLLGWDGPGWDNTTFEAACNVIEFGNSNWSGYDLDELREMFLDRAPADAEFGPREHEAKWASALSRVGSGGRRCPDSRPEDDFGPVAGSDPAPPASGLLARFQRMNLAELLDPDRPPREYVVEPMIAAGTSVALVAPAGHRKSLLLLGLALAVARADDEFAGMPIPKARRVLYVDMENTEDDLRDRLLSFGVTQDADLSRFILVSLPSMEPLDTAKGGAEFLRAVDAYGLERGDLVVLDSYQRITEAGENDSDTTRGYYRHTGVHLKGLGLTVVRTDNTGKDVSKGARGSSGKRDDVDVEYLLKLDGDYIDISVGKARQRGVTQMSLYVSQQDGQTSFRNTEATPTKTKLQECVAWMDEHNVDLSLGHNKVEEMVPLREGTKRHIFARDTVRDAVAFRKNRASEFRD